MSDTGASPNETKPVYSAYTPPAPKKKAKVERTRFRETTHTFRQKSPAGGGRAALAAPAPALVKVSAVKEASTPRVREPAIEKPGKKEKIRFGQKPRETLPTEPNGTIENAGALPETARPRPEPVNPLEPTAPTRRPASAPAPRCPNSQSPACPQPDALAPARARCG